MAYELTGIFLDAYNVTEVKHTVRTHSDGFPVITVVRELLRHSVRKHDMKTTINDT